LAPDLRERLQATLGSTYTLERELGGGGTSRVFVADEAALGRKVVVEVLPPDLAAGVSVDRFKREIQVATRRQHPHGLAPAGYDLVRASSRSRVSSLRPPRSGSSQAKS
jgi:serine/threonine protein kinase